jgi:hypothetical protein
MSDRRRVDVGDLDRAEKLVSIGVWALRHGDAGFLASARRFLNEILARHDWAFRDTLVSTIAADKAKAGGDFHRHRAEAGKRLIALNIPLKSCRRWRGSI